MSKHARREIEPVVTGSLLAGELQLDDSRMPLDDARQQAFGPPNMKITDSTWWAGKPQVIEIDRDKDGKADAFASIDYTIFGNLDTITVKDAAGKTQYTLNTSRFLGHATKLTGDLNGDGKDDITIRTSVNPLTKRVGRLDIDRDGDGKADANMDVDRTLVRRLLNRFDYDKDNDGTVDVSFEVKRGALGGNLREVKQITAK